MQTKELKTCNSLEIAFYLGSIAIKDAFQLMSFGHIQDMTLQTVRAIAAHALLEWTDQDHTETNRDPYWRMEIIHFPQLLPEAGMCRYKDAPKLVLNCPSE